MTEFQRIVKYIALAMGIGLAITIIGGIASILFAITGIADGFSSSKTKNFSQAYENVKSLEIDTTVSNIKIKVGNEFHVEGINVPERFTCNLKNNGTLLIQTGKNSGLQFSIFERKHSTITITIPDDYKFDKTIIDNGTGNITIEQLYTDTLDIDCGVGDTLISEITADRVDIDGGVGNLEFRDAVLNNCDIKGGTGNISITGSLYGKNEFNTGVGNIRLDLNGHSDQYNLKINKGLGNVKIDGESYNNINWNNNNAEHSIKIDGGVGDTSVRFMQ